ncbi:MAG: hypothetical protein WCC74_00935 [Minisyncoccia bacterium]
MTEILIEQIARGSKYFFWTFSFLSIFMTLIYFYSIIEITVSVRQNTVLTENLSSLNLKVSDLEYKYLQAKSVITLETAKNLGFSENTKQVFVSRASSVPSLSLNINEI